MTLAYMQYVTFYNSLMKHPTSLLYFTIDPTFLTDEPSNREVLFLYLSHYLFIFLACFNFKKKKTAMDPVFFPQEQSGRVCSHLDLPDIQSCRLRSLFHWRYAEHHNATVLPQVIYLFYLVKCVRGVTLDVLWLLHVKSPLL